MRTNIMFDNDEEIKPYKPLPKKSKFAKPNEQGQIAKDCVNFNWGKDHCRILGANIVINCNCKVLNGEFCKNYIYGGV